MSIGNFDGVHRGHQALCGQLRRLANELGGPAVAVTFDPHPLELLAPQHFEPILTTLEDRAVLLHAAGVDHVVVLRTERSLLELPAQDFFQRVLGDGLQARSLVEGPNFGFGRRREGDTALLCRLCAEREARCLIVEPLLLDGQLVSSSRVRQALQAGDVALARRWLGRPYRMTGRVATGAQRGRMIGFPTANLADIPTLIPRDGVYAVRVRIPAESLGADSKVFAGAANFGPNPTFGEDSRKVEVHLLEFSGDLYGQILAVDLVARLRDTQRFAAVEDLLRQLRRDVEQARARAHAEDGDV